MGHTYRGVPNLGARWSRFLTVTLILTFCLACDCVSYFISIDTGDELGDEEGAFPELENRNPLMNQLADEEGFNLRYELGKLYFHLLIFCIQELSSNSTGIQHRRC